MPNPKGQQPLAAAVPEADILIGAHVGSQPMDTDPGAPPCWESPFHLLSPGTIWTIDLSMDWRAINYEP